MTLGPKKERVMTAKPGEQDEPLDDERFRHELARDIERFIAKHLELWTTCENGLCRRAKCCASPDRECIARWSESLPPVSPEQARAQLIEFQKALALRIRLSEQSVTAEQIAEAIDRENAAMACEESNMPAPVVMGTKLAPEPERINRARNDTVKEHDRTREPGPRITAL
jgi:hypothetical protein